MGSYTEVAAGEKHTVLLRSDGTVVAFGSNAYNQCDVPELKDGLTYVSAKPKAKRLLQLLFDGTAVTILLLSGDKVCEFKATGTEGLLDVESRFLDQMSEAGPDPEVLMPGGVVLRTAVAQNREATLGDFFP